MSEPFIYCPKRVDVIRLFNSDKIESKNFPDFDSEKWISYKHSNPPRSDIFFIKNDSNKTLGKAIYLGSIPFPVPSYWYHVKKDEYIDKDEITHWMEI